MVVSGHRMKTTLKLIVIYIPEILNQGRCYDLWQTVQSGPFSEKQAQWLMLQLCLVTCGVHTRRRWGEVGYSPPS